MQPTLIMCKVIRCLSLGKVCSVTILTPRIWLYCLFCRRYVDIVYITYYIYYIVYITYYIHYIVYITLHTLSLLKSRTCLKARTSQLHCFHNVHSKALHVNGLFLMMFQYYNLKFNFYNENNLRVRFNNLFVKLTRTYNLHCDSFIFNCFYMRLS